MTVGMYATNFLMTGAGYSMQTTNANYNFVSVLNPTNNTLYMMRGKTTKLDKAYAWKIMPYLMMTFPAFGITEATIFWENGGGTDTKRVDLIFSMESQNLSGILGATGDIKATISSDNVGMLKTADLSMDGAKRLNVNVQADSIGLKASELNIDPSSKRVNVLAHGSNGAPATRDFTEAVQTVSVPYGYDGTAYRRLKVDEDGRLEISSTHKVMTTFSGRDWMIPNDGTVVLITIPGTENKVISSHPENTGYAIINIITDIGTAGVYIMPGQTVEVAMAKSHSITQKGTAFGMFMVQDRRLM